MHKKIGFIGAGNMASAIIKGLIKSDKEYGNKIFIYDLDKKKSNDLRNFDINICISNSEVVEKSDIIFIAVKPNIYSIVLEEINNVTTINKIIVTIAPGLDIKYIKSFFNNDIKVVRTMPNTPALIGQGMTVICSEAPVSSEELKIICSIFEKVGTYEIIDEKYMNKFVAVNGSSPAYVYMFIEAMADAAVLQGIPRDVAYKVAAKSVAGSANMVYETGKHPGALKDMVCSPGGTTIEAVVELENRNFRSSIINAMNKCTQKAEKLSH